jgi:hypothetical protein
MKKQGYLTVLFVTEDDRSDFGAKFTAFMEHVTYPSDFRYNQIHAEIIVNNTGYSAVGRPPQHCVIKYTFDGEPEAQHYVELVKLPVADVDLAQEVLEHMSSTEATYDIPYLKFLVPSIFIKDLDLDPKHWGHLFCSQFVLLSLRKMEKMNIIQLPRSSLAYLYDCPSQTCTPARLRHLLDKILSGQKMNDI